MASDRSRYLALPRTAAPISASPATRVVTGWRQAGLIVGYLLLYLLLDWASMIHPFLGYNITPWSPPPGLSLALLFVFGVRYAPLLFVARFAPVVVRAVALGSRMVPRRLAPHWGRVVLDTLDQRPGPMAATIHGLFFGRVAPPSRLRSTLPHPALVIGHPRDPIHLSADARMVAGELARASYVEASSILEWRLRPARLTERTVAFLDEAWEWAGNERGPVRLEEVGGAVLP